MFITEKLSATVTDRAAWLCVSDRATVRSPQRTAPVPSASRIRVQGTVALRTVPELSVTDDDWPPRARRSICRSGSGMATASSPYFVDGRAPA
ncbi:hypothetical protein GCM10010344_47880 [Streptomyces bluensis]|nr:hypothetical protein GCM10010344_47880 [Streptomyces bluensis]